MARRSFAQPLIWVLGDAPPPAGPHVAVVPGADVPLLPLDLPEKLRGIARERVGRRMLTEQLGLPMTELEVRPFAPKGKPGQWTRALVGEAQRLQDWRAQLAKGCIALVPDYLALPCAAEVWTIETAGETVSARLGIEDGFSAEPDLAEALLAEAADRGKPRAVLRLGEAHGPLDALIDGLGMPVYGDPAELAKDGNAKPLRWTDATRGIDLKEPPSVDFDRLRSGMRRWRAPVLAAVLAVAAFLGSVVVETHQLQAERQRDQGLAQGLVREHFVPSGPILDMRAQVTAAVQAADQAPDEAVEIDPLVLFQTAAPYLTGDRISLRAISYRGDTGLVASVEIGDFAGLDQLVADLRADRFEVELLESSARQGEGVAARLRLLTAAE
ncbi:MAG: type II secretion system protein GspL [Rhodobacter sp.]|nr:type II secretion system protein GspL [Rhodobacter sp.]